MVTQYFANSAPPPRDPNEAFLDYLERMLQRVQASIPASNPSGVWRIGEVISHKAKIVSLCNALVDAHRAFLDADVYRAQQVIDDEMQQLAPFLTKLISNLGPRVVYRMRVVESLHSPTKSGMFHIPFQLRHLVATQRFSIPGIPCLYLGATT